MSLPDPFQFSQGNLQDYVDCHRRFQLRHVLMQPWPGLITDSPAEFERHFQRGAELHHLAHQRAQGVDVEHLTAIAAQDDVLARWWRAFLDHPPADLPQGVHHAEKVLVAPLAGHRLVAKLDLLAAEPGQRMIIVDWKATRRRPSRSYLASRMQTLVYRFLAVEAGSTFFGSQQPRPEQVEMVYWFAEQGGDTDRFPYDATQHDTARDHLAELITEIAAQRAEIWPLTLDDRHCSFCNYRSLCERGVKAGFLDDLADEMEPPDLEISFDLEQVAEVEF